MRLRLPFIGFLTALAVTASAQTATVPATEGEGITQLSTLDLSNITYYNDNGKTAVRPNKNTLNGDLKMRDTLYVSGVGTHAPSKMCFRLKGATSFKASVGLDDHAKGENTDANHGIVDMTITLYKGEEGTVYRTATLHRIDASSYKLNIPLEGYDFMKIDFGQGSQAWADEVDLGDAYFTGGDPVTIPENQIGTAEVLPTPLPDPKQEGNTMVALSGLDLSHMTTGWGTLRANRSIDNQPITLRETVYASGLGVHANSKILVKLNGATRFYTVAGIDDEGNSKSNVNWKVILITADGQRTTKASGDDATRYINPEVVDIDVDGYDYILLDVDTNGPDSNDHFDWASACFEVPADAEAPASVDVSELNNLVPTVNLPAEGTNGTEIVALSSLDIQNMTNGDGRIQVNKSNGGNALLLRGTKYTSGLGVHANSQILVKLNGAVTKFHATVGIDDEVNKANEGDVNWSVTLLGEGGSREVAASGHATRQTDPETIDIDLVGWKYILLDVDKNGQDWSDHFDWANAYFEYEEQNSNRPVSVSPAVLQAGLEVADVWFAQPGVRMMQFVRNINPDAEITVSGLPAGLTWNAARRCVEGTVAAEGEYTYTFASTNAAGESETRDVTLTVSRNLKMPTPVMGWLSWNSVEDNISEEVVKKVVNAFKANGLAKAGFNTIMMDDQWHGTRAADGTPQPNPTRFPNGVKAVADFVHANGMKFGLYTDVAANTCDGAFGSHGYYELDALTYASWDIDVVKVDYCGAPGDQASAIDRYSTFINELNKTGRDIAMIVCEWGVREPWKWAARIGAPTWRSTYDARDCWSGVTGGIGVSQSLDLLKDLWIYNGANRFNDADMMCIGIHGTGKSSSALCPNRNGMTQDEYQTQMSMWCMWSSPLLLSYDVRSNSITDDDLRILTNPEIIAINQDRMGLAAQYLGTRDGFMLFAKDLENGDVAVAVVNLNNAAGSHTVDFADIPALDPAKTYRFRDVWAHDDLGPRNESFAVEGLAPHATAVYRITKNRIVVTGIDAADVADAPLTVTAADGTVTVSGGADGATKRVIVADIAGRLLGQATSADATVTIPVAAPQGTVITVTTVVAGHARTAKLVL